jgi:hypothetical protein
VINPFRSEAEAFRLLLGALGYFGAIGIAAAAGGLWPGLIVFIVLSVGVVLWWLRARRVERPPQTRPREHAEGERRILVVANETVGGLTLRSMIEERSRDIRAEVLVCTPALNSRLRHWTSDEDSARVSAQRRLDASLDRLRSLGIAASGVVGDADPLQAMEDALRTFGRKRSSSRRIPRDVRTGSSGASSRRRANGSQSRSRMSSSISSEIAKRSTTESRSHGAGEARPAYNWARWFASVRSFCVWTLCSARPSSLGGGARLRPSGGRQRRLRASSLPETARTRALKVHRPDASTDG